MPIRARRKRQRMAHVQQYKRKRRVAVHNGIRQVFIHQPSKKRILPASIAQLNQSGIANRAKADLFISIHINSNKSSSPSGVSVYVMGVDKASKNMDVAMKENDVITYEEDYSTRYQGYKPGSTESLIMFSLM